MSVHSELPKNFTRAFKPADIRGIYPEEINEVLAYRIARAFVEENGYKKIVFGYDMRLSTPELAKAFVSGARKSGATVIDIGMVRSPMLYFASGSCKLPGAIITASHSPSEYNGIKLVYSGAVPLTKETGLGAIQKRVKENEFTDTFWLGRYKKRSFDRSYKKYILQHVDRKKYKGLKIVADIGNGMSSNAMIMLDRALPARFPMLFPTPDGSFPNRDSDPCLSKNQTALKLEIKRKNADFGVGFDGDGDRIAFLDENGKFVNCAAIGALIANRLLQQEPGAGIVYTNLTSKIFPDTIKQAGGRAYRARVGHTFLKKKMRDTKSVFGAEHSGHFFWRDFFYTDSTILTLLAVMDCYIDAQKEGKTFSQMMKPHTVYQQTEDVVVHVADKKVALELMKQKLESMKPKKITKFDGYFVDFGNVWGAVKPSVTEFALKLMFEGEKKRDAQKIQKELLAYLKSIAKLTKL